MTYTSRQPIQSPHRANTAAEFQGFAPKRSKSSVQARIAPLSALLILAGCSSSLDQLELDRGRTAVAISIAVTQHAGPAGGDNTCDICAGTGRSGDGLGPCPCKECKCD